MEKNFYLCLENCDEEQVKEYGDFLKIPFVTGEHDYDFDVVMNSIPKDIVKTLRIQAEKRLRLDWYGYPNEKIKEVVAKSYKIPIGFNCSSIPVGAYIIREK